MPCSSGSSSCSSCLALGSSCGWCQSSLSCTEGGLYGPTTPSDCATWAWYYTYCAGDPADKCPPLPSCTQCLTAGRAEPGIDPTSCGWCTDAAGAQRCASGQISGPAVGARCRAGGWLFAQFDVPAQCPALPPSASSSAWPSPSPTPSPSPSSLSATPSAAPTPTSRGPGSGSSSGSGAAAAAALPQALVTAVAVALTLGLLLACACGLAAGWVLKTRLQSARGGGKLRPGSVAFGAGGSEDAVASQLVAIQCNPVALSQLRASG